MVTPIERFDAVEADVRDMVAVADGNARALAALYDRHASSLLAVAMRIIGRRSEAEDVVHDVFIRVWQRAGDYRAERGAVSTWLRLMVRCRSLDRIRGRRRAQQRAERWTVSGLKELVAQPDEFVADRASLHKQLSRLPEDQLRVVMMSYMGGLSASEIANAIDIPIGTVKSRMAAGLAKLRRAYLPSCLEAS